ncbi:IclR family transcriptional regulator [Franzmannia qiaohouensis]|uniref:IclR family transcriptional regulator n=1 Tax=Franzmannia qiaohouensis TaxID=1329370 RepID=A0ABU1HEW2_9GAMM|nr:IclR family transcriptional regulator [Halomonas qiaohouensis]MDR5906009.1 IclR family transcriptional regulator [Halomonas qiaohouensis]
MHNPANWQDEPSAPTKDRNFVTALARGLELLRAFGTGEEYLGNAELSSRTGIPRPTVSRLTYTLTQLGYLKHNTRLEKYRLGPGILALGYRFLANQGIRDIARPHMQQLADTTDCAIALGSADRHAMTYLEVCQGKGPLVMRLEAGSRIPIATTAIGRAWLCGLPQQQRDSFVEELRQQSPDQWSALSKSLDKSLDEYQRYGFCLSEGEWERDVSAVAIPLVLEDGAEIMALNCGGASLRLNHDVLVDNLGPRLRDVADRILAELRHHPMR